MLVAERTCAGQTTRQVRYYLLSFTDAQRALKATRAHWSIENQLHWVLDVVFDEDRCRARGNHSAQNLSVLRHIAINLLKQHPAKLSLKSKRNKAGWDDTFLHEVVFGLDA